MCWITESPSIEGRAAYNCSSLKKYVWSQTYPPSYHQHIIMHGLGRKFPIGLLWVDMLAANRTDFREAWMKLAKDWASFEPFIDTTKVKKHGKREMNIGDPGKPYTPLAINKRVCCLPAAGRKHCTVTRFWGAFWGPQIGSCLLNAHPGMDKISKNVSNYFQVLKYSKNFWMDFFF